MCVLLNTPMSYVIPNTSQTTQSLHVNFTLTSKFTVTLHRPVSLPKTFTQTNELKCELYTDL